MLLLHCVSIHAADSMMALSPGLSRALYGAFPLCFAHVGCTPHVRLALTGLRLPFPVLLRFGCGMGCIMAQKTRKRHEEKKKIARSFQV